LVAETSVRAVHANAIPFKERRRASRALQNPVRCTYVVSTSS
jgi:hypothetical protein